MEAAQGHGVAPQGTVEGAEAHEVNGRFEHIHPIHIWAAGQAECDGFLTAGDIPLKAGAVQIIGAALVGECRLARFVPANEHTVVVFRVLIQKAGIQKAANDLRCDAPLSQVGKHPAVILVPGRKVKRNGFLSRFICNRQRHGGGISGPAVIGQKILHRFRKTLVVEMLKETDGIPAHILRIAKPGAAVLDAKTVHLPGGVVAADPLYLVAQMGQQVRQIGVFCDLHFSVRKTVFCVVSHAFISFVCKFYSSPTYRRHGLFRAGWAQGCHPARKAATRGEHGATAR